MKKFAKGNVWSGSFRIDMINTTQWQKTGSRFWRKWSYQTGQPNALSGKALKISFHHCVSQWLEYKVRSAEMLWQQERSKSTGNIRLEQTFLFWFENEGAQLFLIWVIFWILILKLSWVFHGKIEVSLENYSWLPNSAQLARSAQTVENSHKPKY